ncbi:hypothetical protein ACCD06_00320 [Azospirillum sp. CT11-132]|uniref:hypothetical protein n=1 Tax=unclassified Azospirillum TaxID=2630922 RepID=UPI0011B1F3B6|nr:MULTISPECIES: hypothetical protein [unclassified Azospirillum]
MSRLTRILPVLFAVISSILISGCSVHLVSDYDEQIDHGLTQFNTDLTAFTNRMIAAANTPAGTYSSNKDFYVTQDAKLATLVVRAEAHKVLNSCPSVQLVKQAVIKAMPPLPKPSPIPLPDPQQVIAQIGENDCSVVLLNLIRQGFDQLKVFHEAQQGKGIPADAHDPILVGGIGSLVRSGIMIEIAKKSGGSVSTKQ